MRSDDIQVLGATMNLLEYADARISPPLSGPEQLEFSLRYYGRCIEEDPPLEGDVHAECRYFAGSLSPDGTRTPGAGTL